MTKKIIFRWIKIGLLVYAVIGLLIYYLQDWIFYHPEKIPASKPYAFSQPFREVNIPYNSQSNISIVQFLAGEQPKGVVLYFHGNRENITRYAPNAKFFTKHGYEVWMIDYPGFGKSTGSFTEQTIYDWSLLFYKLARSRFEPAQIILYGKSLGTGFATQLASVRDCKYLLLETPYYSLPSLLQHYLPIYPSRILKFQVPTGQFLKDVTAPVIIFQGTSDWTVTPSNTEKLKTSLKTTDEIVWIKGGSHNDLVKYPEYERKVDGLLEEGTE